MSRPPARAIALVVGGMVTLATACGGGDDAPTPPAGIGGRVDPCKLFSPKELKAHANAPPEAKMKTGPPRGIKPFMVVGLDICQIALPSATIHVGISRNFPAQTFAKFERAPDSAAKPIRGLGDKAVSSGDIVVVLDDGFVLAIDIGVGGERAGDGLERARRLAALGMPRVRDAIRQAQE